MIAKIERITETQQALPRLFSNTTAVTLRQSEKLQPVCVEITPEGCYAGNGRFQSPKDAMFQIIGFDRSNGRVFWIGRGYVVTQRI